MLLGPFQLSAEGIVYWTTFFSFLQCNLRYSGADLGVVRVVRSNPLNWHNKRLKPCGFGKKFTNNCAIFLKISSSLLNKKNNKNIIKSQKATLSKQSSLRYI